MAHKEFMERTGNEFKVYDVYTIAKGHPRWALLAGRDAGRTSPIAHSNSNKSGDDGDLTQPPIPTPPSNNATKKRQAETEKPLTRPIGAKRAKRAKQDKKKPDSVSAAAERLAAVVEKKAVARQKTDAVKLKLQEEMVGAKVRESASNNARFLLQNGLVAGEMKENLIAHLAHLAQSALSGFATQNNSRGKEKATSAKTGDPTCGTPSRRSSVKAKQKREVETPPRQ